MDDAARRAFARAALIEIRNDRRRFRSAIEDYYGDSLPPGLPLTHVAQWDVDAWDDPQAVWGP